jgi:hypothetical protein
MVQAKRECNKAYLENSELLETAQHIKAPTETKQSIVASTPRKLELTLRPCRSSRFGQVGVDFEQMTKEFMMQESN